jgi:hypothetical protein
MASTPNTPGLTTPPTDKHVLPRHSMIMDLGAGQEGVSELEEGSEASKSGSKSAEEEQEEETFESLYPFVRAKQLPPREENGKDTCASIFHDSYDDFKNFMVGEPTNNLAYDPDRSKLTLDRDGT